MTEEEEILRFGNIMWRIDENGKRHHVPRHEWDVRFNPSNPKAPPRKEDE